MIWLLEIQLAELAEARREGREQESADLATHLQRFLMRKNVHVSVVEASFKRGLQLIATVLGQCGG